MNAPPVATPDVVARLAALEAETVALRAESVARRAETAVLQGESAGLRRRNRVQNLVIAAFAVVSLALSVLTPAGAQIGVTLTSLAARVATLETKTVSMSAITDPNTGKPTVRFTAVNVQVVNGVGSTYADLVAKNNRSNGVGNLIVGYNAPRDDGGIDQRTGSHFLILGDRNNYVTGGGLVGGFDNEATFYFASVVGGNSNSASSGGSVVVSGIGNVASGSSSSVAGGAFNAASGIASSVASGGSNVASGEETGVAGGLNNTASAFCSSVAGGTTNQAGAQYSSVGGGRNVTTGTATNYRFTAGGSFTFASSGTYTSP